MNPLTEAKSKLAFTCVHEIKPEPSAESDVLFKCARWLQKNNQLKEDSKIDAEVERLYRIATEHDHHKANINLQNGTMRGHFKLSGEEHLRLSQNLIDAGVATGYYFVGIFLKDGSAGLREDQEMSLPEWDGKLQWLKTRLANVPPEKPSEVLIHKLAKEKVLDPATGKPMPVSTGFNQSSFLLHNTRHCSAPTTNHSPSFRRRVLQIPGIIATDSVERECELTRQHRAKARAPVRLIGQFKDRNARSTAPCAGR